MDFFQDSLIASTTLKATELTGNLTYTNAVNAIDFDGALSFDSEAFYGGFQGASAWSGVAGGAASHFVSGGLAKSWNGELDTMGFDVETTLDRSAINSLNRLAGGLTESAVEYAMTGSVTYNVANFNMFGLENRTGKGTVSGGMLEMHVGGDGPLFEVGRDGTDVSYTAVVSAYKGYQESLRRNEIQGDIRFAGQRRDYIKGIDDAVIARGVVGFSGQTEVAGQLSGQLENIRSEKSNRNLHRIFGDERMRAMPGARGGEAYLDANLALAFRQDDVGREEFMEGRNFDTNGSFSIANAFYESGAVSLERMFGSGKAYAGSIDDAARQRVMVEQKQELINAYYAGDIQDADALLGGSYFDAQQHITGRIVDNRMRLIGGEITVMGQAHRSHSALVCAVEGYDKNNIFNDNEFDSLKVSWMDSAVAVGTMAQENGIRFNPGYADMGMNPIMSADGTASSPVFGGSAVTTLYGNQTVTYSLAQATGNSLYSDRDHYAWDVAQSWAEKQVSNGAMYISAPESGRVDVAWDSGGKGLEVLINTKSGLQHRQGHNFTDTLDVLTEQLIANAGTEVHAGIVVGKYQDYESNKSTGPHSHWTVGLIDKEDFIPMNNAEWGESHWGSVEESPFVIPESVSRMSGKAERSSYLENRELTRMYEPEEYWRAYRAMKWEAFEEKLSDMYGY
jgi:hypothetical protein